MTSSQIDQIGDDSGSYVRTKLNKRIAALNAGEHDGLQAPLSAGPYLVVLALAQGAKYVQPSSVECIDNAAEKLRCAKPGGHSLATSSLRLGKRTYVPRDTHITRALRHSAYTHVHESSIRPEHRDTIEESSVTGMLEVACSVAEYQHPSYGILGLTPLERSAREDAEALRKALSCLGLGSDGPLYITAAILRADGVCVSNFEGLTNDAKPVGVLQKSVVQLAPVLIDKLSELTSERLKNLYAMLWGEIETEAASSPLKS
ncbi:hypothetical protein [Burkholderia gladioli]|uniref:hypothetical protein n=1 Tax=Burkholderia gladioli TaxID=28095 RepID=UPI00163FCAD5|nr:hypothetical protein [Burkholderia gladioli]